MNHGSNAFINWVVLVCSILALLGSVAWGIVDGGWEPWIVALLSVVGILSNRDIIAIIFWTKDRLTPAQRIATRDKWRPKFENYFFEVAKRDYRGDAIIHDVARLDDYPEVDDRKKGTSSWFRVGLMGTSNDGVLLGLRWTILIQEDGEVCEAKGVRGADGRKVILLGELPYEAIESVNFDGDKYYNKPHIFCHFDYSGEPYRRLFYGEEFRLYPGSPWHYSEVAEYVHKRPTLLEKFGYLIGVRTKPM